MITLSKTRLVKRSLLFMVFLVAITAGAFIAAKNIKLFQVNAADSSNVTVTQGDWIYWKDGSGFGTPKLIINPGNWLAYCIDPATPAPSGEYPKTTMDDSGNNKLIKLAIYISSANNSTTNSIMNSWFSSNNIDPYWQTVSDPYPNTTTSAGLANFKYIFMHIVVGHLNHEGETDMENRINTYMSTMDKALLNKIEADLSSYIQNNNDVWLMAKNYSLFNIVKPVSQNVQNIVWIEGSPESGSIKVQKCDKETQSCDTAQGNASFSGIKFEVYNNSGSRIYVQSTNKFYNNGALITSGTTNASGTVTFANLPLNVQYQVKEATTNNSYLLTASAQTTTITTSGGTNTLKFYDDIVRGDLKFTKISDVDGEPMANVVFKIKSTNSSEEHLVITDEDGIVDTSASHASHEFHTNGYDNMEEDELEYLGYGTWFGLSSMADDTKGALPYGSYTITELQCDANKFCYDIGAESQTITINTNNQVIDLGEWSNDCAEFSIKTTATDNSDGDKILAVNQDVEIKDTVEYCLKKGMEFTLEGVLMDKATKQPVLVDGEKVTRSITITPDTTCGITEMVYSLNTKDLSGVDLVIFEDLYYGDELILSHSDFDDEGQSISVAPDIPDTGAVTEPVNGSILSDGKTMIITITGISFGLYAAVRLFSRKRFLSKR